MARTRPQPGKEPSIPATARPAYEAIVGRIEAFCRAHLNEEYEALCRKLAGALARKRPSPLPSGKPETWACGIVRTIGWVNFLDDSNRRPHLKLTAIDKAFGVAESTGQVPSRMDENPMAWMIEVNGFVVDARHLKREFQEEAFRKRLIPYIPEKEDR